MSTALAMGVLLILSSSFVYYAEGEAQPEAFGSILHSFWWGGG